jgi:SAM-dependent methyltransferase
MGGSVTGHEYGKEFMLYAGRSSLHSASVITSLLSDLISPRSVLDIGCARGTWLKAWSKHLGSGDYHGVDGGYVDPAMLEIPPERFTAASLDAGFDLGRSFDLVQSLEVAEHLEPSSSQRFVSCLARHSSRFVLFSAAPPGQGGEHHINERPYEYWRDLLAREGFEVFDVLRDRIRADERISYWYRYNTFLYVRRDRVNELSYDVRLTAVPKDIALSDKAPLMFRLRKALVRLLPYEVRQGIAKLKARFHGSG